MGGSVGRRESEKHHDVYLDRHCALGEPFDRRMKEYREREAHTRKRKREGGLGYAIGRRGDTLIWASNTSPL